jgi:anti-sigma factor RsiW
MIAALYGELPEHEMLKFEAALERDDDLRKDWDELRGARASLQQLAQEESEPDFTFRLPPAKALVGSDANVVPFRRWLMASAAGFAAAASIFLVLLVVGLRVDRTPGGVLVRFGGAAAETGATVRAAGGVVGQEYPTRAEFAALAEALIGTTSVRLDELERRQSNTQAEVARALYDALAVQQQRQYDDLRSQIQLAVLRSDSNNPRSFE